MARDIAASFNHLYGEHFTLPEAVTEDHVALLPGLDGRKMSKSYDNTIPLFVPRDQLKKLIMGILTDSRAPGEPKNTDGSALFQLYQAFASADETATLAKAYADGIAWGDAKQLLFERLDREIAPMREVYDQLIQDPARIEKTLLQGAEKARVIATPFTTRLRHAVGLRSLQSMSAGPATKAAKAAAPAFKQYREKDGQFYFKPRGSCCCRAPGLRPPATPRRRSSACSNKGKPPWKVCVTRSPCSVRTLKSQWHCGISLRKRPETRTTVTQAATGQACRRNTGETIR
jgi:tryptophanyl-tRNA synthetase